LGRPSIYEYAGGEAAFQALAAATHERCLQDEVLEHPFSHGTRPDHVERLGRYWAEVFGGPAGYTTAADDHSSMLRLHAGQGMDDDLGERFLRAFVAAYDDAGLPDDVELRAALRAYMSWAVAEVMSYNTQDATVSPGLPVPRWSWTGRQD
jgi:hemoglobin